VAGLPALEDTQRDREEMAITLVDRASEAAGSRAANLSADCIRESLLFDKRVAYRANALLVGPRARIDLPRRC
jgi:hypothetical protein